MVKFQSYSDLTRKQEELLSKGYTHNSLLQTSFTYHHPDFLLKLKGSQGKATAPSSALLVSGSSSMLYKYENLSFKPKRFTNGTTSFEFEYLPKGRMKDLKFNSEMRMLNNATVQKLQSVSTVEFTSTNAITKITLSDAPLSLNGNLTVGKPEYGIGLNSTFDLKSHRFTNYIFSLWWFKNNRRIVIKQLNSGKSTDLPLDELHFSYYEKLTHFTRIGALMRYLVHSRSANIEFGGSLELDSKTFLKAKINSDMVAAFSISKVLSDTLKMTLSGQMDGKKVSTAGMNDFRLGVRLDFLH